MTKQKKCNTVNDFPFTKNNHVMKKKNENNRKPFFAEFLESQLDKDQARRIQGGDSDPALDQAQTNKYPSDQEDNPQTKKYPSDCEDDTTKPLLDQAQTQKYPSDGDDNPPTIDI